MSYEEKLKFIPVVVGFSIILIGLSIGTVSETMRKLNLEKNGILTQGVIVLKKEIDNSNNYYFAIPPSFENKDTIISFLNSELNLGLVGDNVVLFFDPKNENVSIGNDYFSDLSYWMLIIFNIVLLLLVIYFLLNPSYVINHEGWNSF